MESMPQEISDVAVSDDEEDLPKLFSTPKDGTEQNRKIARGDIVWAEYRQFYWPALVRAVYKKDRKASVWYLDSPKKCFKVSFKRIKSFSDPKISAMIRKKVDESPMKAIHQKVLMNVITFIRRQIEGHNDDPAAYFDLSKPYLAFKDSKFSIQNNMSNSTVSCIAESPGSEENEKISDEESLVSSDDEEEFNKNISRFKVVEDTDEDKARTEAIVKCITDGHINKHLLRINKRRIQSPYQEIFDDAMRTDRRKLFNITACNIVKDLTKLREISYYLMNFYEQVIEGGKCEMVDYVTSVWLPEAINKADELVNSDQTNLEPSSSADIPSIKRELFPSDKLVIEEMSIFTALNQIDKRQKDHSDSDVELSVSENQQMPKKKPRKKTRKSSKWSPKKRRKETK